MLSHLKGMAMETIQFLVQGSAKSPYKVTFRKTGKNLSAYCTCPAGENGQYCKHRFRILEGCTEEIVSENSEQVLHVVAWLPGSDVAAAMATLAAAESEFERVKRIVSSAKRDVAAAMRT
jgi:uncharacterized Zn finger protein